MRWNISASLSAHFTERDCADTRSKLPKTKSMNDLMIFIASTFKLTPITKWEELSRGYSNKNYTIHTDKSRYFLREYYQEDVNEIEAIHAIESFFFRKGIPLPMPIPTHDNKLI